VLGLRDVLDEPEALAQEWERKRVKPAIEQLYDDIWVYGLKQIYDPLQGLGLSARVARRTTFTGYLKRTRPAARAASTLDDIGRRILITPGGGGDGATLIDWTLRAYEHASHALPPALIVTGPFLQAEARRAFERRAAVIDRVRMVTFEPRMEHLMADALGVASMGGYNTFCEILSFDKRGLIVPRHTPRLEQTIRAEAATRLHLARMLREPDEGMSGDPEAMAKALAALPDQAAPSVSAIPGLLDGLPKIISLSSAWFGRAASPAA
jgi:predicted glycosyltransferase